MTAQTPGCGPNSEASRWTVLYETRRTVKRGAYVMARCSCGTEREMLLYYIRIGQSRSCGCLQRELLAERNRRLRGSGAPLSERFWPKVDTSGDCWIWLAFKNSEGYGRLTVSEGVTKQAHRIAYELLVGPIPEGLFLDHVCRNRACVNPDHLEPVTPRENSRRSPLVLKSACSRGHVYEDGSYYLYDGVRVCKVCQRARVAAHTARKKKGVA